MRSGCFAALGFVLLAGQFGLAQDVAQTLRQLDSAILASDAEKKRLAMRMLPNDLSTRIAAANERETAIWNGLKEQKEWKAISNEVRTLLRDSLGSWPPKPKEVLLRITSTYDGDGYRIDNVLYQSRPGWWVTANLYSPRQPREKMPAFILVHSHHAPKSEGELQEMGVTWAKQGCIVLVPDLLGHGERRQHPFIDRNSYPKPYRVSRQDYFFRYSTNAQLSLIGDSLMGWMVWDLMRGVDLLLAQPGVDRSKIIMLGSVAGGGDPAAVTAALDERITAVVPFNFGGPQPESPFPLPDDAEKTFNYAGGGSWESTRNLRGSAKGFPAWSIIGLIAPRGLVYGHEFSWDRERDPVWKRLNRVWGWYGSDQLSYATGRGRLSGKFPEASHCNNIGPVQRVGIHAALNEWFDIPVPMKDAPERRTSEQLNAWTTDARTALNSLPLHQAVSERARQSNAGRYQFLRAMRSTTPVRSSELRETDREVKGAVTIVRGIIQTDRQIQLPIVMLLPTGVPNPPLVVAVAREGKDAFLRDRAPDLAKLIQAGIAIALPDLRGCGETRPGTDRGRTSQLTSLSATAQMLDETLLETQVRDLRTVIALLVKQDQFAKSVLALWGESFTPANGDDIRLDVPWDADPLPTFADPWAGLVTMFTAAMTNRVDCLNIRGGLTAYQTMLEGPFFYLPHDCIMPGMLLNCDLPELANGSRTKYLRLEAMVDALNRLVPREQIAKNYKNCQIDNDGRNRAEWLIEKINDLVENPPRLPN